MSDLNLGHSEAERRWRHAARSKEHEEGVPEKGGQQESGGESGGHWAGWRAYISLPTQASSQSAQVRLGKSTYSFTPVAELPHHSRLDSLLLVSATRSPSCPVISSSSRARYVLSLLEYTVSQNVVTFRSTPTQQNTFCPPSI